MSSSFNLMTLRAQRRVAIRGYLRAGSVGGGLFLALLVAWGAAQYAECSAIAANVRALEAQYAPVRQMMQESRRCKAEYEQLARDERLTLQLADRKPSLSVLGGISDAVASTNNDVVVTHLNYLRANVGHEAGASQTPSTLTLSGVGKNGEAVIAFADRLRALKLWSKVELKGTSAEKREDRVVHNFQLECTE